MNKQKNIMIIKTPNDYGNSTNYLLFEKKTGISAEVIKVYDYDFIAGRRIATKSWKTVKNGNTIKIGSYADCMRYARNVVSV